MRHFTATEKRNGELALREMSGKAQRGYVDTDPIAVYMTEDEKFYVKTIDGLDGPMVWGDCEEFLENLTTVFNAYGVGVDYAAAMELMDDDLREELAAELGPCNDQVFFTRYAEEHEERFGEEWEPAKANPVM